MRFSQNGVFWTGGRYGENDKVIDTKWGVKLQEKSIYRVHPKFSIYNL